MNQKNKQSIWFGILAFLLVAFSIVLNYAFSTNTWITGIVVPFLMTLGVFFGINVISAIRTSINLAKQLFEQISVYESAVNSGLSGFYDVFILIPWKKVISETKTSFIFNVNYGKTWIESVRSEIEEILKKKVIVTAILPDFRIDEVVQALDYRYNYGKFSETNKESTKTRIQDSIEIFKELKKLGDMKIFLFPGTFQHSYFIFDNKEIIIGPQKHGKEKAKVPGFLIKNGKLTSYILDDLQRIKVISEEM